MGVRFSPVAVGFCVAGLALVTACGGGGGSGPVTPIGTPPTPVSSPTSGPTSTNASGVVVSDANGQPLAGVRVVLMPWGPCGATPSPASIAPENDGCPTPLPSPQSTTNASGQFTLNGAPDGHYLLVIGNDATSDTDPVQATVHDNVMLTGGNQSLLAPTLPPVPTITPPTWEQNGEYRLATLNATTETPCFVDWQNERATNGLAAGTIDEWLLENVRAVTTYEQNPTGTGAPWPGNSYGTLTTGNDNVVGGSNCASMVDPSFATGVNSYATNARTEWFAGQYLPYVSGSSVSARGNSEFPIDPRAFADPNVANWL